MDDDVRNKYRCEIFAFTKIYVTSVIIRTDNVY